MTQPPKQDPYGALAEDVAQRVADRYAVPRDRTEFELAMMHAALDAVTEALFKSAKEGCPQCARYGVPARVAVCGPACQEAHTYVAPCEQAVRLAVGDDQIPARDLGGVSNDH